MSAEFVERRVGSPLLRKVVGVSRAAQWARLRETLDRPSWRSFGIAMGALAGALFLALYSGAAAEEGHLFIAGGSALAALVLAGWVALTVVPALARRTPLGWLSYQIEYKVTREGIVYIAGILVVALAALNTGNNLLFMVLACLMAGLLISGLLSRVVLGGIDVNLELPEHIFARRTILAVAQLYNEKQMTPSFSVSLVSETAPQASKNPLTNSLPQILDRPVYFPYIPHRQTVRQSVELTFPRRGIYRQDALGLRTKFPFGFLQKTRRANSKIEVVVYPQIQPTEEFYEVLPLVSGELESYQRGRGNDLYAIREYQSNDSARHVDWKASAKIGALQVKEFAREDERRVMLVLDPYVDPQATDAKAAEQFERAVTLCAGLAWHFYEINSVMEFRSAGFGTPRMSAGEVIYDILRYLASVTPLRQEAGKSFLDTLGDTHDIFKIVLTNQPSGSIPSSLWNTAYFLFVSSL
ncbi:MAG TPA: DUF58 domain-containing protein [Candidatus Acidoferrales bacterium]|jgi:uncharacterized protein (DUF58 family)|nr:DUF58 domain-containing protein [Candidatus Acidoferrales bacterium]